jgi:hypothetical protein
MTKYFDSSATFLSKKGSRYSFGKKRLAGVQRWLGRSQKRRNSAKRLSENSNKHSVDKTAQHRDMTSPKSAVAANGNQSS